MLYTFLSLAPRAGASLLAANIANVLVYSATKGFRHDSIPTAIQSLQEHGRDIFVNFTATEDESVFRDSSLGMYDAVLFLSTTGEGELSFSFSGSQT
jgi:hypothetical protein